MGNKPKKHESRKPSKTPGKKEQKIGLLIYPWWAKLIVCLALVGWSSGVVLFTASTHTFVTIVRQATEPAYIAANLKKMARIETLPAGFKPLFAAAVFNTRFLTLSYEPDHSGFMLWLLPAEDRHGGTARQLTDSLAEKGIIPTISDEFKVEKKGTIPVAGETLEYVSGVGSGKQGYNGGFIGCAFLKDQRALLVYGWTPPRVHKQKPANNSPDSEEHVSFNMDAMNSLLSAIKSF